MAHYSAVNFTLTSIVPLVFLCPPPLLAGPEHVCSNSLRFISSRTRGNGWLHTSIFILSKFIDRCLAVNSFSSLLIWSNLLSVMQFLQYYYCIVQGSKNLQHHVLQLIMQLISSPIQYQHRNKTASSSELCGNFR
ncbi:hypothetical protein ATANTOWER_017204 [Ataeniobius toweri]|uniref:Secreted protein n=1 Tax=Ataeniobius toweri TaxID=208326 RepID=A0ABU7AS35_9TELE|nr:hypothetical protein [Ataeniobius toweri]